MLKCHINLIWHTKKSLFGPKYCCFSGVAGNNGFTDLIPNSNYFYKILDDSNKIAFRLF